MALQRSADDPLNTDTAVADAVSEVLGIEFETGRLPLGPSSFADARATLGHNRFVFLEVERSQRHPSTNVTKYWPWLEEDSSRRIVLVQVFAGGRHRRPLVAWVAEKMIDLLRGRFAYVAVELPMDTDDEERLRSAAGRLRAVSSPETKLPFFAYGIFQPGEIAYPSIAPYVADVARASVSGRLTLRDGLLLLALDGDETVAGSLLRFRPQKAAAAYAGIDALEPRNHYRWQPDVVVAITEGEVAANVLVGVRPDSGSHPLLERWSSRRDPLFVEAMDEIESVLEQQLRGPGSVSDFFRCQMAYLLLWSAIERYSPSSRGRRSAAS